MPNFSGFGGHLNWNEFSWNIKDWNIVFNRPPFSSANWSGTLILSKSVWMQIMAEMKDPMDMTKVKDPTEKAIEGEFQNKGKTYSGLLYLESTPNAIADNPRIHFVVAAGSELKENGIPL